MKLDWRGGSRLVILTKNYAIKIPKFTYTWEHFIKGILSNLREIKLYKLILKGDKHWIDVAEYFAPIVWSSWGGFIVVMIRADTSKVKTKDILLLQKMLKYLVNDLTDDNIGKINNKVVCIDYAE